MLPRISFAGQNICSTVLVYQSRHSAKLNAPSALSRPSIAYAVVAVITSGVIDGTVRSHKLIDTASHDCTRQIQNPKLQKLLQRVVKPGIVATGKVWD